jgi:hypothetical protein
LARSTASALLDGLIAGAIIGAAQWLAVRSVIGCAWIAATSAGVAADLTAGTALVDYGVSRGDLALMGAVSGLAIGGLQAFLLAAVAQSRRSLAGVGYLTET